MNELNHIHSVSVIRYRAKIKTISISSTHLRQVRGLSFNTEVGMVCGADELQSYRAAYTGYTPTRFWGGY